MSTQRLSLKDSPAMRWIVLFIVAFTMMIGYLINDIMSPLESLLCRPVSEGGLGWSSSDYGFFSGAGSLINVYLLMLFFSGLILDKMGTRFTGLLACVLMIVGVLTKLYAITHSFEMPQSSFPSTTTIFLFLPRLPVLAFQSLA